MQMTIEEECNFWLDILSDHMNFFLSSLDLTDENSNQFFLKGEEVRDSLLSSIEMIDGLIDRSWAKYLLAIVQTVKEYKSDLLDASVNGNVKILLPPTFIRHTLNELEQFEKILLHFIETEKVLVFDNLEHHKLWILDAEGHAMAIHDKLDPTEKDHRKKLKKSAKQFSAIYTKVLEVLSYLKDISPFPALKLLDNQAINQITLFTSLLEEIQSLEMENYLLTQPIDDLLLHMLKEENYYINKITSL